MFSVSVQHKNSIIWRYIGSIAKQKWFYLPEKSKGQILQNVSLSGHQAFFSAVALMGGLVPIVKAFLV